MVSVKPGLFKSLPFLTSHLPSEQFAYLGFGEHVPEFDVMGNFVRGQFFPAPFDQLISGNTLYVRFQDHECLDPLSNLFVGKTHSAGADHGRMLLENRFDL
jgi:hypothetical protein